MQNAMDIMAMVQKTSMLKQKFDVPGKALTNEKMSFRKELNEAKTGILKGHRPDTKADHSITQRTTEKSVEKLARVMSNNNPKAEVADKDAAETIKSSEANDSQIQAVGTEEVENINNTENTTITEEAVQSVLDILQQLMQMIQGQKVEDAKTPKSAVLVEGLKGLIQELELAIESSSEKQTEEISKLFKGLDQDLTNLMKQLVEADDSHVDKKQTEQLFNQMTDKMNQAKMQMHQILHSREILKDSTEVLHKNSLDLMSAVEKNTIKENITTAEDKQTVENLDSVELNAAPKADNKNDNDKESRRDQDASYKAEPKIETKPTVTGDKLKPESFQDIVAVQGEQPNFQLNIKQVHSNLQKDQMATINKSEIINQVIKKADILVQGSHQEMIMKLEPESLGKLNLKLVLENGIVTAKFIAESQQVKEVLESSFNQLKDALQEKGIAVQSFSVSVGQEGAQFNSNQSFQQWKKSMKINNKVSGEYMELDDEINNNINPYSYHDGKVDYRA